MNLQFNAFSECQTAAGELGYDTTTKRGYISNPRVSEILKLTLDCPFDQSLSTVNIDFYIGETKCDRFDWRVVSMSSSYSGRFPKGYKGIVNYFVYDQNNNQIANASFNVLTDKTNFKDCPKNKKTGRRAKTCRRDIAKLNVTTEKRVCKHFLDGFRGPIFLE